MMYRLVLHGESHFQEQIASLHDDTNFFGFISEDEKRETAKKILVFMYLLNRLHIKFYLKDVENAEAEILKWKEDLDDSANRQDLRENEAKRIIPLYDFSLAAGPLNLILDEHIPHSDYETDNQACDFALRVSGNSMEPDIPDGSIALVRKTMEIENGQIGAFSLNGTPYCKIFTRNPDGSVFLISSNPDYTAIPVEDDDHLHVFGEIIKIIPPEENR